MPGIAREYGRSLPQWKCWIGRLVSACEEEWQNASAFLLHCVKLGGIDSQRFQNRSGDLRGSHRALDVLAVEIGIRDNQPDVGVAEAKSSVFRILSLGPGINRAVNGLHEDIGRRGILGRIVELKREISP